MLPADGRLARRLLLLCSAASLGLLALWPVGRVVPGSVEFTFQGGRWRVALAGGALAVDDQPQQRLELEAAGAQAGRRFEEAGRRHAEAQDAFAAAQEALGAGAPADPELERLQGAYREAVSESFRAAMELGVLRGLVAAGGPAPKRRYALPLPLAGAIAGLPPLAWLLATRLARRQVRRRDALGRCPSCGYDLRASPGRCPECGAAARTAATR